MRVGRPVLAAAFLALFALVLSIPLRDNGSGDGPGRVKTPPAKNGGRPTSSPTPKPDDKTSLVNYPDACLAPAGSPQESLVAYAHQDGIAIAEIPGEARAVIDDSPPVTWSPSGTYLAGGSGTVYDSNGDEVGTLFTEPGSRWAWSPTADCAVVAREGSSTIDFFVPDGQSTPFIEARATNLSFSPKGGDLAYVTESEDEFEIWVASLAQRQTRLVDRFDVEANERIILAGWTPDAEWILYWIGTTDEINREGSELLAVSGDGVSVELGTVLAYQDFVTTCGNDLVAVVGGGPRPGGPKRLAYVGPQEPTDFLTPEGNYEISPSCSEDGGFIAVSHSDDASGEGPRRLVILDEFGSPVLSPTDDPTFDDAYPRWGRDGTGLLFVRAPESGPPELWHIPLDGAPEATGEVMREIRGEPEARPAGWGYWLDWNADEPSGVGIVSEGTAP
ncbi:MAG: hypothetical protein M3280_00920 [Actinomycetota bacterium]|nr:hypothetical protein [Actinomycetota bacterium]